VQQKISRSIQRLQLLLLLLATLALPAFAGSSTDPLEILRQAEQTLFPSSYEASMMMETVRPGKAVKNMSLTILSAEGIGSLMEITDPPRSKGIRFLQKSDTLLMYSPRSGSRKAVRLSAQESFQGSLFANNDISDSVYSDDYLPVYIGRVMLDHPQLGRVECDLIEGTALHAKAPYGKIEMWVLAENLIPVKFNFYAKSGLLLRTMVLSDLKELGGKLRPSLMRMESITDPGSWTDVRIMTLVARQDLSPSLFTESNLTR
jgi:outer membrane lipoprotein-sorting protein